MPQRHQRITRVLATVSLAAVTGTVLGVGPTAAEPDVEDVQQRVDTLYVQAERASERVNDARIELAEARERLAAVRADLARQQAVVEDSRAEVAAAVVGQYQGGALSSTARVLLADDPDAFLAGLTTLSGFNVQQAEQMAAYAIEADRLELRETATERELARIAATKEELAREKAEIEEKAGEAAELLERLEARAEAQAEARAEARASRDAERSAPAPTAAVSGRAGAAVQFALAQVGDAYVYGNAGPDSWDCSGLTMMAWAQAGVSLPHSSGAQLSSGTPVSRSELAPGDLVFYYSPVSHVGIYIGNGQIVDAANPGTGVRVTALDSMPYSGAVRVG